MVDYFVNADAEFLKRMGADKAKLPQREEWINMLELEVQKEYSQKKLISQPKAENIAPNKTLKKLGFELIDTFETTPGWINFYQTINRYELTKSKFDLVR